MASMSCEEHSHEPKFMPTEVTEPKIRHDWYQTETHIIITILLKNVRQEDLKYDAQDKSLNVTVKLPSGSEYALDLDLAHTIAPEQTSHKLYSTKIEVKLKKQDGIRWTKLEGQPDLPTNVQYFQPETDPATVAKYPSSSQHKQDWDKLVADIKKEEEAEEPQGDAALNSLFQKIYKDGSDEVRKAMNKSFQESGGTVLSTNWKEVGDKPVDVKPPDGMEFKSYEY